ncbi:MAG: translation initiation factor IF-2 subunit alpha [Candidatus Bathyarchaeota archaeon]|nr:translation initiation factor IF-2 subunit alpha [Candidatus Bathyarchaeota archaeon]
MAERKPEYPESGDLVVATLENVTDYGAYAKLDEYSKRGLLHVSEINSSRIRNIRDFVHENQKMVLKVLRVNAEKGHVDLSLRRVTKRERIEKIKSWKKERKADALLRGVAEKVGMPAEQVYEKAGLLLDEKYGLYEGFEKLVTDGPEVLIKLGVSEDLANVFAQVADERIRLKMVKVRGTLEVRCMKPNGVKCVQEAFANAKKSENARDVKIDFHVIAAPTYSLEVSAENWKRAEELLGKVSQEVVNAVSASGGQGSFRREK